MKNKYSLIIGLIIIIFGVVGFLFYKNIQDIPYETFTVKKGNLIEEVSANGKVESPTNIDLRFKNSGKLVEVNTKVGNKVYSGQLLAKQDTAQLDAQVLEMQAGIDLQKAKLNQLLSGASQEDIDIYETAVINGEQSVEDSKKNLIDKIKNAYTKSDDSIRGKSDQLFNNPRNTDPQLIFITTDSQLENNIETQRFLIETMLNNWSESLKLISTQSNLQPIILSTNQNLNEIKLFLDSLSLVVNSLTTYSNISQTTLDKWKNDISTARVNIDTAISNLSSAEESLKTKEGVLKTAQNQLTLKKAEVRPYDVAVYEAQIKQAEASLQKTLAQRRELLIYAPSAGVITHVNGEVGENIGADTAIVSFATNGALQVKLNIVEDKIVNIKTGQEARITFDAIGGETFGGKVIAIDPSETIVGGTVYYQTTIIFDKADERIKSGMTANVWIRVALSEDTLFVPVSAIQNKNSKKFIKILDGKLIVEKEVVTGLKNDSGMIEIVSGVSLGERVILGDKK